MIYSYSPFFSLEAGIIQCLPPVLLRCNIGARGSQGPIPKILPIVERIISGGLVSRSAAPKPFVDIQISCLFVFPHKTHFLSSVTRVVTLCPCICYFLALD